MQGLRNNTLLNATNPEATFILYVCGLLDHFPPFLFIESLELHSSLKILAIFRVYLAKIDTWDNMEMDGWMDG